MVDKLLLGIGGAALMYAALKWDVGNVLRRDRRLSALSIGVALLVLAITIGRS